MRDRKFYHSVKVHICFVLLLVSLGAPHVSFAQSNDFIFHVVEPGQNLYRIALKYQTTVDELRRWNGLKNSTIRTGQKLIVGRRVATKRPGNDPFGTDGSSSREKASSGTFPRPVYGNKRRMDSPSQTQASEPTWEISKETNYSIQPSSRRSNLYTLFLGNPTLSGKGNYSFGSGSDQMEKLGHLLTQQEGKGYDKVEIISFRQNPMAYNAFHQRLNTLGQKTHAEDVVFLNIYATSEQKTGMVEIISTGESSNPTRGGRSTFREIVRSTENISGKKLIICDVNVSRMEAQNYISSCNIRGDDVAIFLSTWKQSPPPNPNTWHHGAIFKAFTLALEGAADFNRDGKITLTEVDIYINDKVSNLTGGVQYGHMIFHNFSQPENMVLARLY